MTLCDVLEWSLIPLILKVNITRYPMDTLLISVAFEVVVQGHICTVCSQISNLKSEIILMFLFLM